MSAAVLEAPSPNGPWAGCRIGSTAAGSSSSPGLGGAAAGIALTLLDPSARSLARAVGALFGAFAFPLYALSVAHTNDHVEPDSYVETASGLLMAYALGAVAGPAVASAVIRLTDQGGLFAFTAAVHVATAVFAAYRMLRREAPPPEDQIDFNEAVVVTQTVSTVDPLPDESPSP